MYIPSANMAAEDIKSSSGSDDSSDSSGRPRSSECADQVPQTTEANSTTVQDIHDAIKNFPRPADSSKPQARSSFKPAPTLSTAEFLHALILAVQALISSLEGNIDEQGIKNNLGPYQQDQVHSMAQNLSHICNNILQDRYNSSLENDPDKNYGLVMRTIQNGGLLNIVDIQPARSNGDDPTIPGFYIGTFGGYMFKLRPYRPLSCSNKKTFQAVPIAGDDGHGPPSDLQHLFLPLQDWTEDGNAPFNPDKIYTYGCGSRPTSHISTQEETIDMCRMMKTHEGYLSRVSSVVLTRRVDETDQENMRVKYHQMESWINAEVLRNAQGDYDREMARRAEVKRREEEERQARERVANERISRQAQDDLYRSDRTTSSERLQNDQLPYPSSRGPYIHPSRSGMIDNSRRSDSHYSDKTRETYAANSHHDGRGAHPPTFNPRPQSGNQIPPPTAQSRHDQSMPGGTTNLVQFHGPTHFQSGSAPSFNGVQVGANAANAALTGFTGADPYRPQASERGNRFDRNSEYGTSTAMGNTMRDTRLGGGTGSAVGSNGQAARKRQGEQNVENHGRGGKRQKRNSS